MAPSSGGHTHGSRTGALRRMAVRLLGLALLLSCFLPDNLQSAAAADWLAEGQQLFQDGRYLESAQAFSQVLQSKPDDFIALFGRGNAYLRGGQAGKAVADFSRAIDLRPESAEAHFARGVACQRLDREQTLAEVRRQLSRLRERREKGPADNRRADTNESPEQVSGAPRELTLKACYDFSRAIELDPINAEYYFHRAGTLDESSQFDATMADLNKAIELNPRYVEALICRGGVYYNEKKDTVRAMADLNLAVDLDPSNATAYANRARVLRGMGELQSALTDARKAAALEPGNRLTKYLIQRLEKEIATRDEDVEPTVKRKSR